MNQRILQLLDTITAIDERCAGTVIVTGSHGGVSSSGFVLDAPARPYAVFFNDAGVGKQRAGIVALELLEAVGIVCATYSHQSARIGDARDGYDCGVITHVNGRARAAGLEPGQRVCDAVAALCAA
ncbi:MAG: hypothetical protein KJ011_04495 [Burkholderiaceae bacterium]|nr:hypothetical protein [Burkholderiaceae bacterium]